MKTPSWLNKKTFIFVLLTCTQTGYGHKSFATCSENDLSNKEAVFHYAIDKTGIAFQVKSGGCTFKSSFKIRVKPGDSGQILTLIRTVPDYCKARLPHGTLVWYSFAELGLDPQDVYSVDNPLTP